MPVFNQVERSFSRLSACRLWEQRTQPPACPVIPETNLIPASPLGTSVVYPQVSLFFSLEKISNYGRELPVTVWSPPSFHPSHDPGHVVVI